MHPFILTQVHEVVLTNEDLGSVITWDFDVLRHSVCFSVFRTKNTVSSPNGTLQPNQNLIENDHKSVIDKQWKEGHDYFRVEASIVCHDGESVQVRTISVSKKADYHLKSF